MAILSGYEKYKRHLKVDDENYKLVSEWTHADTVEMIDGKSLTENLNRLNETININISFGDTYDFEECTGYVTVASNLANEVYHYIFYKDGTFITSACHGYGNYYSVDGVNWTKGTNNLGANYRDNDMLYANGVYLIAGTVPANGVNGIQYSYDFKTWSRVITINGGGESDNTTVDKNCLAYGNGIFVAGGKKEIIYSMDGTVWKLATLPSDFTSEVLDIAYGNGIFVAVTDGKGLYSTDGVTWLYSDIKSSTYTTTYRSITYNNGKFVAVGATDYISFSYDGIHWNKAVKITNTTSHSLYSIEYINDRYIAVGNSGCICYSYDGIFWKKINSNTSRRLYSICYGNGKIVIGGNNIIICASFKKNDTKNIEACINELYNKKMAIYSNVQLTSNSWENTSLYGYSYKQEIPIVDAYDLYPEYFLKTLSTTELKPTEAEQVAYDLIDIMQLDMDNKKLIFYAYEQPQASILVIVRNVLV